MARNVMDLDTFMLEWLETISVSERRVDCKPETASSVFVICSSVT